MSRAGGISAPIIEEGMLSLATIRRAGNRDKTPAQGYGSRMTDVNSGAGPMSAETRAQILNSEIADYARRGWNVQSIAAGQAVLSRNKRMGWFWNLILVLITGGLWLIYVIYRALNRKQETLVITVDPDGRVRTTG